MLRIILACSFALLAACKPQGPEMLLQGGMPKPQISSLTLPNELFVVVTADPYGHRDLLNLVVAEDGAHGRVTVVAPSALALKKGDVIKVSQLCYRADERVDAQKGQLLVDACTDVVTPYAQLTPEAPPPPAPPVPTDSAPPPAAPNPQ